MARPQEKRLPRHVSDEELDFYGELYLGRAIREAGVDFETFLSNPDYFLAKYPPKRCAGEGGDVRKRRRGFMERLGLRSASHPSE